MSSLALLLLLFLCLSLHACTSRPLSLTKKDTAKYHFNKGLDKIKLLQTLTASSLKDCMLEEHKPEQKEVATNGINISKSCGSASALKEMIVGAKKMQWSDLTTSFPTDSPSSVATKAQKRDARSMLGPQHHGAETEVTNARDTEENMVEMDYAQPHRKPPIHNEKP